MAELKTKLTGASVDAFLAAVADEKKRQDSLAVLNLLKQVTGAEPKMWGDSIIGFGSYHYKYASGQEGDWPPVAFSPRKQNLTIYLMSSFEGREDLLQKLGRHKTGKGCLYIKKLEDIDLDVLKALVERSVQSPPG